MVEMTSAGPAPVVMMTAVPAVVTADPMIDSLSLFPTLLVKQRRKGWLTELCLGCEVENEYKIYNPTGANPKDHMLLAKEESSFCWRQCCGNARRFTMSIWTNDTKEVCRFERPFRCGYPCCKSCRNTINCFAGADSASPGTYLGCTAHVCSCCVPTFVVLDENDNEVYRIIGNCCGCATYTLNIYAPSGPHERDDSLGTIQKRWSGLSRELFTDADTFFVTFPTAANGKQRVLLLGALLLIDFMFFERRNNGGA
ncbi:Phospholipid scramblase 2 [Pelomyxa schiedti]|nr:Phospholipid scramblase 2 [Pelomyxa schiedti]